MQTQFSRLTAQDHLHGVRDVEIDRISTETVSSMITKSIAMIVVECPHLPQGVGHTCLDGKMTDALIVLGRGFQSTPETQALMRDPSSFKVWWIGTGLTEKATIEIIRLEAGYTFQDPSVSAEPSEQQ